MPRDKKMRRALRPPHTSPNKIHPYCDDAAPAEAPVPVVTMPELVAVEPGVMPAVEPGCGWTGGVTAGVVPVVVPELMAPGAASSGAAGGVTDVVVDVVTPFFVLALCFGVAVALVWLPVSVVVAVVWAWLRAGRLAAPALRRTAAAIGMKVRMWAFLWL